MAGGAVAGSATATMGSALVRLGRAPAFVLPIALKPRSRSRNLCPRGVKTIRAAGAATTVVSKPGNPLKLRLAAGETLYGLFLLSFSPTLAEIAGIAGYDYVVVDMEHGPGGISDALSCVRALAAADTPAVLRLPEPSPAWAKKALDLGPQGIMFPMVESVRAAELAVAACRYPPRGIRGAAHPIVRASRYGLDDAYLSRCEADEEILVMCQVETAAGVAEIEAVAAVDGVDVVQMGPLDLSASMGYLWDPGYKKVQVAVREAERKVLETWKKGGAYLGGFAMPHDHPEQLKLRGYHMVSGASDISMFRKSAADDVSRFHGADVDIGEEEGSDEDNGTWSE